ncbi:MAG: isopentenyl-diphosphate Delta-isomerase [Rikenellaceae bacterium]|nr:isopentenyl-diphosphate Delta-isomerase [Rikenellaceae bacterium]
MVILVDSKDNSVGETDKMEAHLNGSLHRAVSVLLYNGEGRMLLQRRAAGKYHSPGLWANACCTHPLPGETTAEAASRRLRQEMGLRADLTHRGSFIYEAPVGKGLTEHEYDHIFSGISDTIPLPDPTEVMQYKYMDIPDLFYDAENHPEKYAVWFRIILNRFPEQITLWSE